MHGLISLWTNTPQFQIRRDHLMVATLAFCSARKVFETVEFATDWQGLEIAFALGWNKQVDGTNTNLKRVGRSAIWALGKFHAMLSQAQPFCQLDMDVLMRKELPPKLQKAAIFAQSIDRPSYYKSCDIDKAIHLCGLRTGQMAYNCGIIGGNDLDSIHRYCREALKLSHKLSGYRINGTAASMVIEQYFLGQFCSDNGIRLETLLPPNPTDADAAKVGYTHLHGESKRRKDLVRMVEHRLQSDFPEALNRFKSGWNQVTQSFTVEQ